MMYEDRFTDRAKSALEKAHESACDLGHGYVGSEHILLGIVKEGGGAAARVLRTAGLDEQLITDAIEKYVGRGEKSGTTVQGLTPRSKRILELAGADGGSGHAVYILVGNDHDRVELHLLFANFSEPSNGRTVVGEVRGVPRSVLAGNFAFDKAGN